MEERKPKEYEETTQWDHLMGVEEHLEIVRRKPNHAPWKRESFIGLEGIEYKVCARLVKKEKGLKGKSL